MKDTLKNTLSVAVVVIALAGQLAQADDSDPIGEDAKDLPIFDAHMHYHEPAWTGVSPEVTGVCSLLLRRLCP